MNPTLDPPTTAPLRTSPRLRGDTPLTGYNPPPRSTRGRRTMASPETDNTDTEGGRVDNGQGPAGNHSRGTTPARVTDPREGQQSPYENAGQPGIPQMLLSLNHIRKPPIFSGKQRSWVECQAWLAAVIRFLALAQIAENQKVVVACQFMDGDATTWYNNIIDKKFQVYGPYWEEFVNLFEARWQEFNWEILALKEYHDIKQTGSLDEYTDKFQQAYSVVSKHVSVFACIQHYIDGLKPRTKLDVQRFRPKDLNDAMAFAAQAEALNSQRKTTTGGQINSMQQNVRTNTGKGQKETRDCFYCHKKGHLKKDCRKLKKDKKDSKDTATAEKA